MYQLPKATNTAHESIPWTGVAVIFSWSLRMHASRLAIVVSVQRTCPAMSRVLVDVTTILCLQLGN